MNGTEERPSNAHIEANECKHKFNNERNAMGRTGVNRASKHRSHLWFIIRIVLSIALLAWVLYMGYREGIFARLLHTSPIVLIVAVLSYAILQCLSALKWWLIARATDMHFPLRDAVPAYFIGMFFNLFLPGIIGGDTVRAYLVSQRSQPRSLSLLMGTIYAQRATGFAAMVILGFIGAAWLGGRSQALVRPALIITGMVLIAVTGVLATLLGWRSASRWWQQKIGKFSEGAFKFLVHPRIALTVFAMSFVYHIGLDAILLMLGVSSGMHASFWAYAAMVASLTVISMLPIAIHGLGVRELAAAQLWTLVGMQYDTALLWALLWRAMAWLCAAPGGLVYLVWMTSGLELPAVNKANPTHIAHSQKER